MDQGSGDGADDDSYQHNGGDDENHETLAGLVLECLLFHRVYLAIALEGMDGIHENFVAVSVVRGGDVDQRRCNRDIQFNIWFLRAFQSSPTFPLLSIFSFILFHSPHLLLLSSFFTPPSTDSAPPFFLFCPHHQATLFFSIFFFLLLSPFCPFSLKRRQGIMGALKKSSKSASTLHVFLSFSLKKKKT